MLVPKGQQSMMQKLEDAQANMPIKKVNGMYVPEGRHMNCILIYIKHRNVLILLRFIYIKRR